LNLKHSLAEFSRAKKALRAAQVLLASSLFEDAISLSYYAVMHAAKAALLAHDTVAESHRAMRRFFNKVLVCPGLIEREWSSILARVQDQSIVAEYNVLVSWEQEDSQHLIEDAQAFVQRIRDYLVNVGITP